MHQNATDAPGRTTCPAAQPPHTPDASAAWPIDPVGDRCLLVRLGHSVDLATNARVHALVQRLQAQPIAGVRDIVPAFTTVALHYRPECFGDQPFAQLSAQVRARLGQPLDTRQVGPRTVAVPICYGGDYGPDLAHVAQRCGLGTERVIALHLGSAHRVYMLGFAPGFPFIGGLDPALAMPRRDSPRTRIPPGSVAIAREQTCIYPLDTPGGWNIIGRTPLRLFEALAEPPCLLAPGDAIRFERIDANTCQALMAVPR
jgi:inhibitor of KinA